MMHKLKACFNRTRKEPEPLEPEDLAKKQKLAEATRRLKERGGADKKIAGQSAPPVDQFQHLELPQRKVTFAAGLHTRHVYPHESDVSDSELMHKVLSAPTTSKKPGKSCIKRSSTT